MSDKKCKECSHNNYEHEHEENSKLDKAMYLISIILFTISFIPTLSICKIYLCLLTVILAGYKLIIEGIKNIIKLNFEEDTLMTIAIIAAFILGEFPESCMVVLLFKLGEFLEHKAVENSNKNIKDIVEIKSNTANLINKKEEIELLDVENVKVGDIILIKPGEVVPLDCIVIEGETNIDTSSITGESKSVYVSKGDKILSGTINLNGSIKAKVQKDYKNSTATQIVDLVYEAKNNKGKTEKFITRFSKVYTPIVIILAILIAVIPTAILGQDLNNWIMRALVFLVASCPCSIVISVPLAFFSCIGAISKKGILIKGTKHIESLANSKYVAFDKTGTITTGKMKIDKIVSIGNLDEKEILSYLYWIEQNSNHPISTAIVEKVENEGKIIKKNVSQYEEIPGYGISSIVEEKQVLFGNRKLLQKYNIETNSIKEDANYLIIDGKIEGYITLKEEIREQANNVVKMLKDINIKDVIILTGDNKENSEKIAKQIGIEKIYSSLLPQEKLYQVKKLKQKGKVIFVGDGINDSPVLAASDFGISIGEGAEIANNTADGILISNNIETIPNSIKIARKSMRIIKFNIAFSLIIKAIVLILGILGIAPVWAAVVADTGVSFFTVINSARILKK